MSQITFDAELDPYEKKDGTHTIQIRITQLRKKRRISSGVSVLKAHWNPEKKEIRKADPLYRQKNATVKAKILELEQEYLKSSLRRQPVTATGLVRKLKKEVLGDSFLQYADRRIEIHSSPATRKAQRSVIAKLREYRRQEDLLFSEIDYEFLEAYQRHLKRLGNSTNTIHANFKTIKALYNHAVKSGNFEPERISPFARFSVKKEKSKRAKLTEAQIEALARLEIRPDINEFHARNIFLFSFYTQGMRTADVLQLTWGQVDKDRLTYTARKTGKARSIKLIPKAAEILNYYRLSYQKPTDYVFRFLKGKNRKHFTEDQWLGVISAANALINKHLTALAVKIGVPSISMHVARHSFADIARRKTGNVYLVSEALDHSSVSVTENYFASAKREENDGFSDTVYGVDD
ncbi:phage integrase SAM-like domain-containing protein [Salmonirosea aquatica]|uniref:Tyrosine-type recombinase/integrase n=1 Tax=Salmonirosea aquatica TaxID=2654236 RepID=A0A7C9F5S1_9BACT|nr:tyrosine-type recombinase/integrase [Cytophagaceae bacterium SJW1-29]